MPIEIVFQTERGYAMERTSLGSRSIWKAKGIEAIGFRITMQSMRHFANGRVTPQTRWSMVALVFVTYSPLHEVALQ